jgi:hypothetical protein
MGLSPTSSRGGAGVSTVTAGDSSITVAGTASAPTVAVAAAGVTTAKMSSGAAASGLVATADGAGAVSYAAANAFTAVVKASDESVVSSSVLQNDDELFFSTVNNGVYWIVFLVRYASPAGGSTPGLKVAMGEDGTTRGAFDQVAALNAAGAAITGNPVTADNASSLAYATAAADRVALTEGIYLAAGGTFRVLWAQSSSNVSATIVRAGSALYYRRIS